MALKRITEEEMNAQGVIAAPDILNGTPAQNKAIFDRMVRSLVAPAVNACVEAVEEVNQNEAEKNLAEQERKTAEAGRVEAEKGRVAAEQAREDSTSGIVAQATEQAQAAKASADGARALAAAAATSATNADNSALDAANSASDAAESSSSASNAAEAARAAQAAAEKARDEAQGAVGGDLATKEEARGYAETAESNAKAYTDKKFSAIPTPDVSGQISAHNSSTSAHADIRTALSGKAPTGYGLGGSGATVSGDGDLNNVTRAGWYVWYSPAPANAPDNHTYCAMRVDAGYNVAGIWCKQTAWRGQEGTTYERQRLDNGTWTAWKRIDGAKIVTGSYTGTGTFGSDGPCSLTFDFEPKIIMMVAMTSAGGDYYQYIGNYEKNGLYVMYPPLLSSEYVPNRAFAMEDSTVRDCYAKKVGNTVYWYHRYTPNTQANTSGCTYHYMAIG